MRGNRSNESISRPSAAVRVDAPADASRPMLTTNAGLLVSLGMGLALLWWAPVLAAPAATPRPAAAAASPQLQEQRWRPWLGCWQLQARSKDGRSEPAEGVREVCFEPAGGAVRLVNRVDGRPVLERLVFGDGVDRSLREAGCEGRQRHSWSADGERLFTRSHARCDDGSERVASGVALLLDGDAWLDIQLVALDGQRELIVRRYRAVEATPEPSPMGVGFDALVTSRGHRAAPLDVDDVVEAVAAIDTAAVEAMLVETRAAFDLDGRTLVQLAERGVPESVIDLMVALSFPDDFVVEGLGPEPQQEGADRGYAGPPPAILPAAAPGYWSAWFAPFGYGFPYYPTGFGVVVHRNAHFGGRVIAGHGYARVRPAAGGGGFHGLRSRHARGGRDATGRITGGGSVTPAGTKASGSKATGRKAKPRGRR